MAWLHPGWGACVGLEPFPRVVKEAFTWRYPGAGAWGYSPAELGRGCGYCSLLELWGGSGFCPYLELERCVGLAP